MRKTLLDRAKSAKPHGGRTVGHEKELLDLAMAFGRKEITAGQARAALGDGVTGNVHTLLACRLMTAMRNGVVRVEVKA